MEQAIWTSGVPMHPGSWWVIDDAGNMAILRGVGTTPQFDEQGWSLERIIAHTGPIKYPAPPTAKFFELAVKDRATLRMKQLPTLLELWKKRLEGFQNNAMILESLTLQNCIRELGTQLGDKDARRT